MEKKQRKHVGKIKEKDKDKRKKQEKKIRGDHDYDDNPGVQAGGEP